MFDNLNYYRVFYTVANTGNISKAADMLFISQPAISKAISKLEDGLHVKLFLRSSKGVTLTDEGQVLYNHIEKAFSNISQGEDEIRHIHELGIGQLKIGVSTLLLLVSVLAFSLPAAVLAAPSPVPVSAPFFPVVFLFCSYSSSPSPHISTIFTSCQTN